MAASSSSSSSSFRAAQLKTYDVFLSFRGEDTRKTFVNTLHGVLRRENIRVFIDNELNRGEEISFSLLKAIEGSMISVIVFSKGFASSRSCLEELVKILECKKIHRQEVIPVFFYIDPSDVKNQTGTFGYGFAELVQRFGDEELSERWRNALTQAANISGWTLNEDTPAYTSAEKIVGDISKKLNDMYPAADKNLVGIDRIIGYINLSLELRMHLPKGVGIWGMGGIGKTTVASVVFNRIRNNYEDSYFAANVREESRSPSGLTPLREKLLSTLFKYQHSTINFNFIKGRLGHKKVLIVFDDVTSLSQIEFLIGDLNYLGHGSLIIITSRDKQVLRSCGIKDDDIYEMKGLSDNDALQLFSWYAFHQAYPNRDYHELSKRIVKYANGVPLALKVLGSFLGGKPKQVWESAIKKLEIIPHKDIQKVLKISYDDLDNFEKNIFLDIACFLKWEDRDFVIDFLNACEFHAEIGISVLIDKCLVTISDENKITMHDLLQEMGWEIVRQESIKDPGERSRLWHYEDIYNVLEENMGTKAIEGICLDMSKRRETIQLQPCTLAMMRDLRFFKLHNSHYEENNINKVHVSQDLNYVLSKLRYFCWHGCPLKSLQSNFHLKNLVALDMPYSNIEQIWTGFQLITLKHIDLSYSKHLIKIQDLSFAPNLERLILKGCTSLLEISLSTQNHNKHVLLNLGHCRSLHSLPKGIHLESLRKVILSCCSNLKTFQTSCNLEELFLDETPIEELSLSIENPSRLVILNLKNCAMLASLPSNICKLKSLEHLNLSGCTKVDRLFDNLGHLEALKELNLTNCCIKELPNNLGQLSSLESLFLGRNNFESIPTSIRDLSRLSYLDVSYCERLRFLPKLPSRLKSINAHSCKSLEAAASLPELLCNLPSIDTYSCTTLEASSSVSIQFPRTILRNVRLNFGNCLKLDRNALKEIVKDALQKIRSWRTLARRQSKEFCLSPSASICFPGIDVPEWFSFQSQGSSIIIELQSGLENPFYSFDICVIAEFRNYHDEGQGLVVGFDCIFRDEVLYRGALGGWDYGTGPENIDSDHIFLGYDYRQKYFSSHNSGKMTFQFYVTNVNTNRMDYCIVKKCGVNFSETAGSRIIQEPMRVDKKVEDEEQPTKRLRFSKEGESS